MQVRLLTLLIILAAVSTIGVCRSTGAGCNQKSAEGEAARWAAELGLKVEHIRCNTADSDGDSYVACSLKLHGEAHPMQVECAAALTFQSGCREPKVRVPGR